MIKKSEMTKEEMKSLMRKIVIRFSFLPVFLVLLILLPAGTFNYWQVYIYFAILVIPIRIIILADIFILLGYLIIFFVFKQNSYASRVVEVDKNQKVISTGLYRIVRHPMYFGVLIMFIPTPVALGSYWGLIPMATVPLALVFRILNEENVLCKELSGYKAYCQKTQYRLIPFLW